MKIFVSSVMAGFTDYRHAAFRAIESLGYEVIRAEDYGASPNTPQQVCLAGVRGADAVVLVLGERYGFPQNSGLSATHEEYREARDRCPVLVFVQQGVTREPAQETFVREAQSWNAGQFTANFSNPEELRREVTKALHRLEVAQTAGSADGAEMLARADGAIRNFNQIQQATICVAVAGGPRQQVLRPTALDEARLKKDLMKEALFGDDPLFVVEGGARAEMKGNVLIILQDHASFILDEEGQVCIKLPAMTRDPRSLSILPSIIEEEVQERIEKALRFTHWVLERIDPAQRITDVVPVAAILGSGYLAWRTRAEQTASPNMISHSPAALGRDSIAVHLSPAYRKRAALLHQAPQLSQDFTALLQRQKRPS